MHNFEAGKLYWVQTSTFYYVGEVVDHNETQNGEVVVVVMEEGSTLVFETGPLDKFFKENACLCGKKTPTRMAVQTITAVCEWPHAKPPAVRGKNSDSKGQGSSFISDGKGE